MTVINSIREIVTMPVQGLSGGAEPVMGFNYGAGKPQRVRQGIVFISVACAGFSILVWVLIRLIPEPLIALFNNDPELMPKIRKSAAVCHRGILRRKSQCMPFPQSLHPGAVDADAGAAGAGYRYHLQ